jgi:hypothetical protein
MNPIWGLWSDLTSEQRQAYMDKWGPLYDKAFGIEFPEVDQNAAGDAPPLTDPGERATV